MCNKKRNSSKRPTKWDNIGSDEKIDDEHNNLSTFIILSLLHDIVEDVFLDSLDPGVNMTILNEETNQGLGIIQCLMSNFIMSNRPTRRNTPMQITENGDDGFKNSAQQRSFWQLCKESKLGLETKRETIS